MLEKLKPWIGSLILLPFAIFYAVNMGKFTFVDYFNLLIHEAGHGIFKLLGEFIYTLGGTLMQLIMPGIFIYYFVSNQKKIGTQISILWLGESFMNVSIYAADARARQLPLLGGNNVYHDWNWILSRLNMLEFDTALGWIFYGCGIAAFILALLYPLFYNKYERVDIDLKI
ncbi:MAG: hypothetical protein JEY94_15000 [Melioribacteraceae bacterium]|nr:hypothetical protein [Melioribacteraceae bacterium]